MTRSGQHRIDQAGPNMLLRGATVALLALAGALSCGGDGTTGPQPYFPEATTLTVSPAAVELTALGATVQLSAEVRDQMGEVMAGATVTWASGDDAATVNGSGLVTAAANGSVTITATAGDASGSAAVTVAQEVSAVVVTPDTASVLTGDTLRLAATATDANEHAMTEVEFVWASGDTAVAVVDATGLVAGVTVGEVQVTATGAGLTGRAELTVAAPLPTTVAVTPDTVVLTAVGQTAQLAAEVRDQLGRVMADAPVTWASADTTIAVVDSAGVATAVGSGATTITATAGGAVGAATVTVMQSAGSVVVTPSADTIAPGDTLRLAAEAFDANGHVVRGADFAWSSSAAAVATVDPSGLVRGAAEGTATITATAEEASGTSEITVVNPDRAALVALYNATDGPNWIDNTNWLTDAPLEEWYGVDTDGQGRVHRLGLSRHGLTGEIPLELGGLSNLESLSLNSNALWGDIPPELGDLSNLEWLSLSSNDLSGEIPPELGGLSNLEVLWLSSNDLSGEIPPELGGLSNLESLLLSSNDLSGEIPPELGGLSNLEVLWLSSNDLSGEIPPELGGLSNLESLLLSSNDLSGEIPPELGGLSNLESLLLSSNDLSGEIPPELGGLSNLEGLYLDENALSGEIPPELGGLSNLERLYLNSNDFSGAIPQSFLRLDQLQRFRVDGQDVCVPGTSAFLAWLDGIEDRDSKAEDFCNVVDVAALGSLYDLADGDAWTRSDNWLDDYSVDEWYGVSADSLGHVTALDLEDNGLTGHLSGSLGSLSRMTALRVSDNALAGRLPLALTALDLDTFEYDGTDLCESADAGFREWLNGIPERRGTGVQCAPLTERDVLTALYASTGGPGWTNRSGWLSDVPLGRWHGVSVDTQGRVSSLILSGNALTGAIPPELGDLSNLTRLDLNSNALTGAIPPELGGLSNLESLWLSSNDLSGEIPPELGGLSNLVVLYLRDNALSGEIPLELGGLSNLESLYLRDNALSGEIPPELGNLTNLERLYLGQNDLSGPVPPTFGGLASLTDLELSHNAGLAGAVSAGLRDLTLESLLASGTELCVPRGPAFEEWLLTIPKRRIAMCGEPPAAYLVQAVQSRAHPVPLVAGEEALLRVFVTAAMETTEGIPDVRARFHLNGNERHVADIAASSTPIPTEIDEGDLAKSANAEIPGWLVQPGLEMVVEIDPGGELDASLGVPARIPAEGRLAVEVRRMPTLDLTVIPFLWNSDPDSAIIGMAAGMAADPEGHHLLAETHVLLPVGDLEVTARPPVASTSNNSFDLLDQTEAIRVLEGGGGHYMGMMSGRAGGVARWPGRSNFSAPSSSTIAHELGHNMSLGHAPCGPARYLDQSFPYPNGAIGAWGYDFGRGRLIPATRKDHMSYCGPAWTSDYHFTNALRHRLADESSFASALAAAPTTSLLLWGGVDSAGMPYLNPAFVADAPPALPDSAGDHTVTGRDANGRELFSLSFAMATALSEEAEVSSFVYALPVRAGWEDLAQITLSGPDGTATLDAGSDAPMAILRDPRTGQVRGFLRDVEDPAAVQAAAAAAAGALGRAGDGLDILFSRGIPNAREWRR